MLSNIKSNHSVYTMIDIGVNWSDKRLFDNYNKIIKEAVEWGITGSVAICNSCNELPKIYEVERKVKQDGLPFQIVHTVGYHPMSMNQFNIGEIIKNVSSAVAIGECGLDYNRMFYPKDDQLFGFIKQIELATEYNKPLYCHERMAINDFTECLNRFSGKVVVHCCSVEDSDSVEVAISKLNEYIKRNYSIGLTTYICKKGRADSMRKAIQHFGNKILDFCMVETDSPYMSPPKAPRINTPAWTVSAVETLSELTGASYEECEKKTIENTKRFFNL